jgi:hypothetical protein
MEAINHGLTEPQVRLLLKLHARPATVHSDYRPLKALIEKDLVRARHLGQYGGSATYELSPTGTTLAQQIKEYHAAHGLECTCARQWSLKHEPQCPQSGKLSPASSSAG